MLIGLTGLKGSGKDTVGAHLIKAHNFKRVAFANALKQSAAALFDIPAGQIDQLKNDPDAVVTVVTKTQVTSMSFREMLQRYGTEAHREIFGENFWVDIALPLNSNYIHDVVITDCRFKSETDRIKELGGYVVRIERPGTDPNDAHPSEQEQQHLDTDYSIINGSTIKDLLDNVDRLVGTLREQQQGTTRIMPPLSI